MGGIDHLLFSNTIKNIANYITRETYSFNESNRHIYNQMFKFINGDRDIEALDPFTRERTKGSQNKGFYIAGGTGRGKSVLMQVFAETCKSLNIGAMTISGASAVLSPKIIGAKKLAQDYVKKGYDALIHNNFSICIDDVGAEPYDSVHMGNHISVVDELITNIYERGYGYLFVTSNIPLGSDLFVERYGDRLQSRIISMCNYLELRGEDFRVK